MHSVDSQVHIRSADTPGRPCTSYECMECMTLCTEPLPGLQGEDRERVMGCGVCAWLGWPL